MDYNDVIIRPVLSEKSTELSENKKYVFRVSLRANKMTIKKAMKAIFNVTAERVNVIIVRGKRKRVRHQYGITPAWKKAIVTLKEGEKIDLFENR
ncbi:MAG TPA: 50S ribosomal protein L23 [Spirochaetota bacterium]|jgi:large subunit ribosomal protein L23|nr:50S ribosomal protein L23 [Spirochaetota bacterium]OPZ38049.1 MAG: 50S ribosomal protein L23 [Spirochaetes bacterium ADurb.BinA120]HNU91916.1 50S ribosomal protein L23 [Spirochaetota bacterium]HPO46331.1 50S ribosomal protein L23 [Spirochaetota bacterium]HPV97666.1 50S ribosomal protein L23 [Spirochaetota bacterium]